MAVRKTKAKTMKNDSFVVLLCIIVSCFFLVVDIIVCRCSLQ